MAASGRWSWRPAGTTARVAQGLLYAVAALAALAAALALSGAGPAAAGALLASTLQLLLYAGGAVAVLRWIYLANANARAMGADDLMVSPGWAVGWFFVPLLNLVMPFIAMRELWKASVNPRDWQGQDAPLSIPFWWGFWIASGVTGTLAWRMASEFGKEAGGAPDGMFLVSQLLTIPAALLLARIIGGVQALQARWEPRAVEALQDRVA